MHRTGSSQLFDNDRRDKSVAPCVEPRVHAPLSWKYPMEPSPYEEGSFIFGKEGMPERPGALLVFEPNPPAWVNVLGSRD